MSRPGKNILPGYFRRMDTSGRPDRMVCPAAGISMHSRCFTGLTGFVVKTTECAEIELILSLIYDKLKSVIISEKQDDRAEKKRE